MRRLLFPFVITLLVLQGCSGSRYNVRGDKVEVKAGSVSIRLQVVSPEIIRVSAMPEGVRFPERKSLVVVSQDNTPDFSL